MSKLNKFVPQQRFISGSACSMGSHKYHLSTYFIIQSCHKTINLQSDCGNIRLKLRILRGKKYPVKTQVKKEIPVLLPEYLHVKMKPQISPQEFPVISSLNESEIYLRHMYMRL